MITITLSKEQKADIAHQYLTEVIKERTQWFKDIKIEHITEPEAIEVTYEISLLRQALEYVK